MLITRLLSIQKSVSMKTKPNCLSPMAANYYRLKQLICLPVMVCFCFFSSAQCPGGYMSDSINWDNLDFLHNKGSYYGGNNPVSGLPWVSSAMWQTQKFAIGTNQLTFSSVIPAQGSGSLYGDVTTHTGNAGGFNGADVHFLPASNGQGRRPCPCRSGEAHRCPPHHTNWQGHPCP